VHIKLEKFAVIAHNYYLEKADLFKYGRPRIIERDTRTWDSEFIRIRFFWLIGYNFYDTEHPIKTFIRLVSQKKYIGLKDWKKQYPVLLKLMNKNKNKKIG